MIETATTTLTYPHQAGEYFVTAGTGGTAIRRIRTPHPHDVLAGRGGGINAHPGNEQFREWVKERKNDYNLAANKADKAVVARAVIDMVKVQNPPGRFLMRDPNGGVGSWWIELDDVKTMAKTSQALREGAPSIRAQYKTEFQANKQKATKRAKNTVMGGSPQQHAQIAGSHQVSQSVTSRKRTAEAPPTIVVVQPLMSNSQFQQQQHVTFQQQSTGFVLPPPTKITKLEHPSSTNSTPTLVSASSPVIQPVALDLAKTEMPIALKLSDIVGAGREEVLTQDFVNPFENEIEKLSSLRRTPGFNSRINIRNVSSRALIDLDPIGSYEHWDDSEFDPTKKSMMEASLGLDLDDDISLPPIRHSTTTTNNPFRWVNQPRSLASVVSQ
mmetsp:Transcript_23368/g.34638  ORF Transcript_23368/g.34638 Transcript_23368/m.34638 type:complete len:385 (-) Transcript_23368:744-1898(-)